MEAYGANFEALGVTDVVMKDLGEVIEEDVEVEAVLVRVNGFTLCGSCCKRQARSLNE